MLVVRSNRVVLPGGERSAALHIVDSVIERIVEYARDDPTGAKVFNAVDLVVSPGQVDTHVHINEPGRAEWEGFDTATRAAGGVTTLVDMPLNSIPATTNVSALHTKGKRRGPSATRPGGSGGAGGSGGLGWPQQEQAGAADATEATRRRLAEANREYDARFRLHFHRLRDR